MIMRIYKKKDCVHCGQHSYIAAKGLCRACYQRNSKRGTLEYAPVRQVNYCKNGCGKPVVSNGLCDPCRNRVVRYGTDKTLRPKDWGSRTKHPLYIYWGDTRRRETLNICKEWKEDFWSFVQAVGERPNKNCFIRAVDLNKELGPDNWQWIEGLTEAERHMVTRQKRVGYERSRVRVSTEERSKLLEKAGNKCQICGSESNANDCPVTGVVKTKALCVDHCHDTGRLRGILCRACNTGLGHFKDDIKLLEKAIKYLGK